MDHKRFLPWLLALASLVVPASAIRGMAAFEYLQGTEHIGALVHLMEWSYTDIKNECNFLDHSGYYGVIISPPVEHIVINENPGWTERYMTINFKNLVSRSGNLEDLKEMLDYCTRYNRLRFFVDLNLNNMLKSTIREEVKGFGYTKANPKNHQYPDIGKNEFHTFCKLKNMNDIKQVRECEVDDLQDLDNNNEIVRKIHVKLMNDLIGMGVTGFRMAMARYIYPDDLCKIYKELTKTRNHHDPIIIHDINDLEKSIVTSKDYNHIGTTTDYEYSTVLANYFLQKSNRDQQKFMDYANMDVNTPLPPREKERMVFLYNHVTQRSDKLEIIKPKNQKAHKMATAFMMSWPYGIPTVLSSYKDPKGAPQYPSGRIKSPRPDGIPADQEDYDCIEDFNCEHRLNTTLNMAKFNADVKHHPLSRLQGSKTDHWFAFSRGDIGFIVFNAGTKDFTKTFHRLLLKPGDYCDLASGDYEFNQCTGKMIVIQEDGSATITIKADDPNGYVAITKWTMIKPWLRTVQKAIDKNQDVKYLVNTAGKVMGYVGGKALGSVNRVIDVLNKPDVTGQKILEAAATKDGADIIQATSGFLIRKAKDVALNANDALKKKLEENERARERQGKQRRRNELQGKTTTKEESSEDDGHQMKKGS